MMGMFSNATPQDGDLLQTLLDAAAQQNQQAQAESETANQAYQQSLAAPPPQINPAVAGIGSGLARLATTLAGPHGPDYAGLQRQTAAQQEQKLGHEREANLARLLQTYNKAADRAMKLGDTEAEIKARVAIQKIHDQQQEKRDEANRKAAEHRLDVEESGRNARQSKELAAKEETAPQQLTPELLNAYGDLVANGGPMPNWGRSKEATKYYMQISQNAVSRHPGLNLAQAQIGFKGAQTGMNFTSRAQSAAEIAGGTLEKNIKYVEGIIPKIPDTGNQFLNSVIRHGAKKFGNVDVPQFQAGMLVIRNEAARLLGGTMTGGGQIHVEDQKSLHAVLGNDFTKKQLKAVISLIRADRVNRLQSGQEEQQRILGQMGGTQQAVATHRFNPATGQIEAIP